MKMFFYIAESAENTFFTSTIIKRCESHEEAVAYCEAAIKKWQEEEGLDAFLSVQDGLRGESAIVGAEALDSEFIVRHYYHIFQTPCFMAGFDVK